jgi:hypothetical protein
VRATRFDEDIWIWGIGEGPGTAGSLEGDGPDGRV